MGLVVFCWKGLNWKGLLKSGLSYSSDEDSCFGGDEDYESAFR